MFKSKMGYLRRVKKITVSLNKKSIRSHIYTGVMVYCYNDHKKNRYIGKVDR